MKLNNISIFIAVFILGLAGLCFSQTNEQITLTTYYPSPQGSYVELRSRRVAIGDNYLSPVAFCWPPTACANVINGNADLVIEGRVGIGTITPAGPLSVSSPIPLAGTITIFDETPSLGDVNMTGGTDSLFAFINSGDAVNGATYFRSLTDNYLLYLKNDGNIGIGKNNPTAKLHILGDDPPAGNPLGIGKWFFAQGTGESEDAGKIWFQYFSGGVPLMVMSDLDDPSRIQFQQTGTGTSSLPQFSSWIGMSKQNSSDISIMGGNVGIGTLNPTHLIELPGGAFSDGVNWTDFSDRIYKKDIDYNFKYGIKAVEQLKPVYYVYKKDKINKKQIGFIAQDVLEVVPEVVEGKEGAYGLDYGHLTAVLVNAIKEQQEQQKQQQDQINELKQEISKLKAELNVKK